MTKAIWPVAISCALFLLLALGGCGDRSRPVSEEQLKSPGAQKSADFQKLQGQTKAKNSGAPGLGSK